MDDEIIGSISTIAISDKNCNCEVGYCLGYDYWNMTYEGKLRDYYQRHDGTYSDSLVYSILRKEFI